jgi:hypothetical protein
MYELVRVGNDSLIGEIIRLEGDTATIQASSRPNSQQQTLQAYPSADQGCACSDRRRAHAPRRCVQQQQQQRL